VLEVRECRDGDVDAFEDAMPTGGHRAHASHLAAQSRGECVYLVALRDGEPAGSAVLAWACHDDATRAALPDAAEISNVGVRPDLRGQGIGTALLAAAEQRAQARGVPRVALGVGEDNPDAGRLYRRRGYLDSGLRVTFRYPYPDGHGVVREVVEHTAVLVRTLGPGRDS
jgi:ribosomal protein S18 acetylase RimI-like enzyme